MGYADSANNGYAGAKAGSPTAISGGTGQETLGSWLGQKILNFFLGSPEANAAWGHGYLAAKAQGPEALNEYLRNNPPPAFESTKIVATAAAGGLKPTTASVAALRQEFAVTALAKSTEEMVAANAAHVFAKGRFDAIGSQQEVTAGIVDAMRVASGRLVEGNNTITTLINNQVVTVRARLQDGVLSNVNAFPGTSTRTMGNVLDLR